jgi:hypothetical protein
MFSLWLHIGVVARRACAAVGSARGLCVDRGGGLRRTVSGAGGGVLSVGGRCGGCDGVRRWWRGVAVMCGVQWLRCDGVRRRRLSVVGTSGVQGLRCDGVRRRWLSVVDLWGVSLTYPLLPAWQCGNLAAATVNANPRRQHHDNTTSSKRPPPCQQPQPLRALKQPTSIPQGCRLYATADTVSGCADSDGTADTDRRDAKRPDKH